MISMDFKILISGQIDFNEFWEFSKNLGFHLDKDKLLRLFSNADRDNDAQLSLREFQFAVVLLKIEIAYDTLKKLGMTTEDLIWFGIMGLMLLLLLFVFIFFGIVAFSKADVFNSVVNSIMPMVAGVAVAARKLDLQSTIEKVKDYVERILSQMSKKI